VTSDPRVPANWPAPGPEALACSQRLVDRVLERLAVQRFLPFDDYMHEVLYAPGLGYYAGGSTKLGAAGDFVTAPEVSPLFGQSLAVQIARTLSACGSGAEVVEFGAGSGALAAAVLVELARRECLPAAYVIVEISPDLQARQRERLAALPDALARLVSWRATPPGPGLRGVILANEVLDAMAVARFVIAPEQGARRVLEEGVEAVPGAGACAPGEVGEWNATPGSRLQLSIQPARPWVRDAVARLEADLGRRLPPGYRSELAPRREAWLATVAECLEAGLMLLVDYGLAAPEYYAPDREDGTLLCHYRHRAHADALFLPGLQDITAWVDFSAVARQAVSSGLRVAGFTTQAGFLVGNEIDALAAEAFDAAQGEAERVLLSGALRRLLLPGEMGERFRVMALTRGDAGAPGGFDRPDLRHSLQGAGLEKG
jgi:SAM-dependent MidA family methyltransferase